MALDSVFANPPPCAVRGNKDTFKHDDDDDGGEKESWQNELSDHSDECEGGEVEEGEIIDSGEENGDKSISNLNPNKILSQTDSIQKKKKKRKKRKKKLLITENMELIEKKDQPIVENNNKNNKKIKKKKKQIRYVDHDKVMDDWQTKQPQIFENKEEFNSERKNKKMRKNANNPKKRKSSTNGGPEKKKSKKNQFAGKGKRRESRRHRTTCKFYLEGKCNKGNECTFLHDLTPTKKLDLCKFYLNGFCAKGDKCLFLHKEFPCKFFHTSVKCYSQEQCKFSHEPLTDEMRRVLERYLDANKDEDFHPPSPKRVKQSLESPSRDSDVRKIPSLFDIQVGTPNSTTPMPSPPDGSPSRPNFYSETLQTTPKDVKPSPSPETTERRSSKDFELPLHDIDMRKMIDHNEIIAKSDEENKLISSDSENEIKRGVPIAIPSHLPKKQRELFLRIQQQQREAENSQDESDRNDQKKDEAEKEENWYSSDEDDDTEGDKPLTDVLKKLQQQPPQTSATINIQPTIDIAKMIGLLYKTAPNSISDLKQTDLTRSIDRDTRDPRKRKSSRPDPRYDRWGNDRCRTPKPEQRVPEVHQSQYETFGRTDKDMRQMEQIDKFDEDYVVPYKLCAMTITLPNYAQVLASTTCKTDPKVVNDPRLKKENHKIEKEVKSTIDVDKLAQNGLTSLLGSPPKDPSMPSLPPIVLPHVEPPNPYLLSPTEVRPKQADLWSGRLDPRLGKNITMVGRHCGLPTMPVRERTPFLDRRVAKVQQRQKSIESKIETVTKDEIVDSSLKNVFKTIDPTASPFC